MDKETVYIRFFVSLLPEFLVLYQRNVSNCHVVFLLTLCNTLKGIEKPAHLSSLLEWMTLL